MSQLLHQFSKKYCKASVPDLRPGYLVKVYQTIKEGTKERIQMFEGTVIAVNAGHGVESTFTVRKISEGVGVERVYPIHSPNIVKIDVLRAHKVRRAKLGFLKALSGKALRLKEVALNLEHKEFEQPEVLVEETTKDIQEEVMTEKVENETPIEESKEEAIVTNEEESKEEAPVEEEKKES